eukprot:scaffold20483_cov101-Isochrysis_galbana.AAC.1
MIGGGQRRRCATGDTCQPRRQPHERARERACSMKFAGRVGATRQALATRENDIEVELLAIRAHSVCGSSVACAGRSAHPLAPRAREKEAGGGGSQILNLPIPDPDIQIDRYAPDVYFFYILTQDEH